ncbi:MAG: hypothetical protein ACRYG4_06285 [Janthinobacterium lividum]
MPKGYRGVYDAVAGGLIAVCIGLAAIGLAEQKRGWYPHYKDVIPEQARQEMVVEPGGSRQVHNQPCRRPEGREESELCANWYSAEGSHDAAKWAFWQLWISAFGILGLGITLFFNRQALRLAMDATKDADAALAVAAQNADAATRLADAAIANAQVELRAYLSVAQPRMKQLQAGVEAHISITVINNGRTPARNAAMHVSYVADRVNKSDFPDAPKMIIPMGSIANGEPRTNESGFPNVIPEGLILAFDAGSLAIFAWGWIEYEDVFGLKHKTTFRLVHDVKCRGGFFANCEQGNGAD